MNDDQRLLASAALDGELTGEEQARADADPEVLAEVERLRRTRAALRDGIDVDARRRDQAIAAAMAAWDDLVPRQVTAPPLPSLSARRRSRWMAPLAGAAAAVVVVVGSVLALRSGGSDDRDEATSEVVTDAPARSELSATARDAGGAAASTPMPAAGEIAPAAPDAGSDAAAEDSVGPQLSEAATPTASDVPLSSPADLVAFALRTDGAERPTTATCDEGRVVGITAYVVDDVVVPVEVSIVEDPHEAVAARLDDCVVVARAALP